MIQLNLQQLTIGARNVMFGMNEWPPNSDVVLHYIKFIIIIIVLYGIKY